MSFEFFSLITVCIVHNKLRKQMCHHGNEAKRFLGNSLELLELAYSVVTCKENVNIIFAKWGNIFVIIT